MRRPAPASYRWCIDGRHGTATSIAHMSYRIERRSESRLCGPFGAVLFRRTAEGRQAESTLAEEISGQAVRLRVSGGTLGAGDPVFAMLHLTVVPGGSGPRVAIRGRVRRVDRRADGSAVAVVTLRTHRWLFAESASSRLAEARGAVDGPTHHWSTGPHQSCSRL